MKSLITYYSKTGNTKKIASEIAKILKADVDEIIDLKKRAGFFGFLIAGKDALFKKTTKINFKKNPTNYDLVVIGTPIWAGTITPAVRTYLKNNKFKKLAFFSTCANKNKKGFQQMELLSKKPLVMLDLPAKEIKNNYKTKLNEFCKKLK